MATRYEYCATRTGAPQSDEDIEPGKPPAGDGWELVGPAAPMLVLRDWERSDSDRATGRHIYHHDLVWTWRREIA